MGTDITSFAERKVSDGWKLIPDVKPFDWRNYALYGWLADVRNYHAITPISPARGLPDDMSPDVAREWGEGREWCYDASWLSIAELEAADYDTPIEDRRVTKEVYPGVFFGGETCEPGKGRSLPLRYLLSPAYFTELERLKSLGAERIVFWFGS